MYKVDRLSVGRGERTWNLLCEGCVGIRWGLSRMVDRTSWVAFWSSRKYQIYTQHYWCREQINKYSLLRSHREIRPNLFRAKLETKVVFAMWVYSLGKSKPNECVLPSKPQLMEASRKMTQKRWQDWGYREGPPTEWCTGYRRKIRVQSTLWEKDLHGGLLAACIF